MVRRSSGVTSVAGLAGASICVPQGTTTELNLADYFKAHAIPYQIVTLATPDDALRAYQAGGATPTRPTRRASRATGSR